MTDMQCSNMNTDCRPPKKYCAKCSHAHYYGEVLSNGRIHRFRYNPQFGPMFLTSKGASREVQPSEKNPVWDKFQEWLDKRF